MRQKRTLDLIGVLKNGSDGLALFVRAHPKQGKGTRVDEPRVNYPLVCHRPNCIYFRAGLAFGFEFRQAHGSQARKKNQSCCIVHPPQTIGLEILS